MASFKEKLSKLNIDDIIFSVMNTEGVSEAIIKLNQEQLSVFGIDREGKQLRTYKAKGSNVYSDFTIKIKKAEGKPYDHVTLYDQGKFYKTFSTETAKTYTSIKADEKKDDGYISDNLDTSKIYGITNESKTDLVRELIPLTRQAFRKALNG